MRKIENPQHTDWEIKRLDNFADEKKKVKNTLRNLKKEIEIFIKGELTKGSGDSTDMVGAGEFLPSPDDIGDTFGEGVNTDFLRSTPLSATPVRVGKTSRVKEGADGSVFSNGEKSPSGEDGREPQPGERSGSQNPDGGSSPDSQFSQGGKKILKKTPLGGLSFRNFGVDEGKGKFILKFTSLVEEPDCEISLLMCGIERDTYPVDIIRAFEGGRPCRVKDGVITGLCLQKDRKYSIEYEIKPRESFSCEVRAYACR